MHPGPGFVLSTTPGPTPAHRNGRSNHKTSCFYRHRVNLRVQLLPRLLLQLFIYLSTSSIYNNLFEIQFVDDPLGISVPTLFGFFGPIFGLRNLWPRPCANLWPRPQAYVPPWELRRPFGTALITLNLHTACVLLFDFDDSFREPP